jgi:phage shock protein A
MAGLAERLKSQIKTKTSRVEDLRRRILANNTAGNVELAGSLARELQELTADLANDAAELEQTEEAYQLNMRQAKLVQREFEDKIRGLEQRLSQVQIKEAEAEAAGALGDVAFKVGDLGDTMKTVDEVLTQRYEISAGKARVATDLVDTDRLVEKEGERKALEQVALAEFLASQGVEPAQPIAPPIPAVRPPARPRSRSPGTPSCSRRSATSSSTPTIACRPPRPGSSHPSRRSRSLRSTGRWRAG